MDILGISAYYHDSAAALVRDGDVVAAAQEERFTRKKFDRDFPKMALGFCLREAGIEGRVKHARPIKSLFCWRFLERVPSGTLSPLVRETAFTPLLLLKCLDSKDTGP